MAHKFYEIDKYEFTPGSLALSDDTVRDLESGKWESSELQLCKKYLRPEDKILELGACLGVVSTVVNKMLEQPTNHVVVEANPATSKVLQLNKEKNDCHFHIENCLVFRDHNGKYYPASGAPQSGSTIIHNDSASSRVPKIVFNKKGTKEKKLVVNTDPDKFNQFDFDFIHLPTTTIEALEEKHGFEFNVLIVDIEGGEFQLLKENVEILKRIDMLIIEFHHRFDIPGCNKKSHKEAHKLLESVGLVELKNEVIVWGKTKPKEIKKKRRMQTPTEAWGRP